MSGKITFLPISAHDTIKRRMYDDLRPVHRLVEILKKYDKPHNIEGIFQAVEEGPDKELNLVMAEVEKYIKDTKMPVYLQEDAREKARNSVDTAYSDDVRQVLAGWNNSIEKEDLYLTESGEVAFTENYRKKLEKAYTVELPPHLAEIIPELKQLCELYRKLDSKVNLKNFLERYFLFTGEKTEEEFFSHLYSNRRY